MGDHNKKPDWEEDLETTGRPLRRPNASNSFESHSNKGSSSIEDSIQGLNLKDTSADISIQSKLSVDAKEWFPKNYKRHSAQDRLLKLKSQQELQTNGGYSESNGVCINKPTESSDILLELQEFINIVIEDPGQFDDLLDQLVKDLTPYYSDPTLLSDVAKFIFEEAVAEPNFRYSAARLCRILEEQAPLFRPALHLLAGTQVENMQPDSKRDLAFTLAELFAQSNCDNFYGNFVLQSIEKIVSVGSIDNIKCVCQVLKLTGAALDVHHKSKMNSIFHHLQDLKPGLPSLTNLLDYVISLRESNWGQADINSYSSTHGDRYVSSQVEDTIFYGPDGNELSEEEKQFLAENCVECFTEDLTDSDPDELFDPDNEMDEEVHAAFREFTKSNRK